MKLLSVISFLLLACCPLVLCLTCSKSQYGPYDKPVEGVMTRDDRQDIVRMMTRNNLSIIETRNSECPELYKRYSADHTFCKVSTCDIISKGITDDDKKVILDVHNSLRSRLASGKEQRYRKLPSAANMMQMEWDDELARVAQALSNLCVFQHDDGSRCVESFSVGQNLLSSSSTVKNWNFTQNWYKDEVCFYFPQYINPFQYNGDYGHFTQFTWATSWKIGCGFTAYRENGKENSLYTCNYGPGGNTLTLVHYIEGEPCSKCPDNTGCSTEYPGLCKSKTEDGPQITRPSSQDFVLFCDFNKDDPKECANVKVTGSKQFSTRHIYMGDYKTVVLQAGESITMDLGEGQDGNGICPFFYGRFGPNDAKNSLGSKLEVVFKYKGSEAGRFSLKSQDVKFHIIGLHMTSAMKFEVSFVFQANEGAAPQYLDVKAWGITRGACKRGI
uniref:Putative CAP peptide n=1 Tax=Megacormus gertschi TaxID=1843536 RepID=A0A224X3L8_9SCOR